MNISEIVDYIKTTGEYSASSNETAHVKEQDIKLVNAFVLLLEKNRVDRDEYIKKLKDILSLTMNKVKYVNGSESLVIAMEKEADKYDHVRFATFSSVNKEIKLIFTLYIPSSENGFNPITITNKLIERINYLIEANPVSEAVESLNYILKELPKIVVY